MPLGLAIVCEKYTIYYTIRDNPTRKEKRKERKKKQPNLSPFTCKARNGKTEVDKNRGIFLFDVQ